jgi:hypothetical protein
MPAAQGEVTNREVRFTLRFRRTITIAARSASSSFVTGAAATAVAQSLRPFGSPRRGGYRIRERRRAWNNRRKRNNRRLRTMMKRGRPWRRTPDASAIGTLRRKRAFRGNEDVPENEGVPGTIAFRERGRRRTRQDQISCRAFGPTEIAGRKDTRTERRKTCFFCRTGFERASLF